MIQKAFAVLYNQGLICRAGMKGTKEQATDALVSRAVERKQAGEPVAGMAFFLADDVKDGAYPIHFGAIDTPLGKLGHSTDRVGRSVVKALKQTGCWCEWDGDPQHVILVKEN